MNIAFQFTADIGGLMLASALGGFSFAFGAVAFLKFDQMFVRSLRKGAP